MFPIVACGLAQTLYANVNFYLLKVHSSTQNIHITKGIREFMLMIRFLVCAWNLIGTRTARPWCVKCNKAQ